jgi:lipoic acid synthetase
MNRLPLWFKQRIPDAAALNTMRLVQAAAVNTVCREARCPNSNSCFSQKQLTFMILGDTCTRNCRFCKVKKAGDKFLSVDENEPARISRMVEELGLKYIVITSVTRDDLLDGGAGQFVKTIKAIRKLDRGIKIEVLIPDFGGDISCLKSLLDAGPDVIAHNIETVPGLYKDLRPQADYSRSLEVLLNLKLLKPLSLTKSSIMLGLGESPNEVIRTMKDLAQSKCDILTLGQYLAPSPEQVAVKEFILPEQFDRYKDLALALGFKAVFSGPLVRSSYKAEEIFKEASCV